MVVLGRAEGDVSVSMMREDGEGCEGRSPNKIRPKVRVTLRGGAQISRYSLPTGVSAFGICTGGHSRLG